MQAEEEAKALNSVKKFRCGYCNIEHGTDSCPKCGATDMQAIIPANTCKASNDIVIPLSGEVVSYLLRNMEVTTDFCSNEITFRLYQKLNLDTLISKATDYHED